MSAHSPAAAIAWEFRQRHRWGWIAMGAYLAVLAIIRIAIAATGRRITFEDPQTFALAVVVPLAASFLYVLAVFSYGLAGDFSARHSIFPARMFAAPVTTEALAAWPMLYGGVAMALLWLAMRFLGIWPANENVPVFWPMLLAPSLLAWTQALTWMPYPLAGMRAIVTVVWLATIDAIVMVALQFRPSELLMLAILAPNLPLAYLVARGALRRARSGGQAILRVEPIATNRMPRRRRTFRSAAAAQFWLEWREHGLALPALVAMLVPFELAMLFVFPEVPAIVIEMVALVLLTPPLMALFTAPAMGGLTPFLATKPLTSGALISAKLRMAVASTLASWVLIAVAMPAALQLSGTMPIVVERAQATVAIFGRARAVTLGFLGVALVVSATWKQLVQSLYIGMSGRSWLIKGSVFLTLAVLVVLGPALPYISLRFVLLAFPWIAAVLVVMKIGAGSLVLTRLRNERSKIVVAAAWNVAVFALFAILAWIFPEMVVRRYPLCLIAILAVPLARVSAASLALEWSRHR